jgi:hypothetical protein
MTADIKQMKRTIAICALISLIPLAIIGAGVCWALKRHAVYTTYKKTKGEILKLETKRENRMDVAGQTSYYPRIVYSDENDQAHVFTSKVGSNPPIGREGERINLLVNPSNPKDVVIDTFFFKWFGPTVVSVIGLVLLLAVGGVSAAIIAGQYKQRKTTEP